MSDKAAGRKTRGPEGCNENGPAAALLLSHVSIQICSFVAPCRRPILIATPLPQSLTWCTCQKIQELAGGNLELSLSLNSLEEIVPWILSWGKDCEVVSPVKLQRKVRSLSA
ncbi:MAG TPA: WYL domain-containing protein [Chthoniobacterales bacterium]|nr:WYL domain-containing protein [Chthoniobacterales bacterium]